MAKTKEDRSDWVAVAPDASSGGGVPPPVRPARSAYAFFQRERASSIRAELAAAASASADGSGSSGPDVGALGREVSARWQGLSPVERRAYDAMAARDRDRFLSESRQRDAEALERRERMRRERETLVLEDDDEGGGGGRGGRTTRGARARVQRKAERKRSRKEEKREARKRARRAAKAKKAAGRGGKKKDDDSDYEDESDDDSEDDSGGSDSEGDSSEEDSDGDSSSASSSDDSGRKRPARRRAVSQAVLDRRERARNEKQRKERYIEKRQEDVREERAEQATRRLQFLLKQSDIFSHFGNVKQEKARLGIKSSVAAKSSALEEGAGDKKIVRTSGAAGGDAREAEEEEREEADEHEATYLSAQPATLGHGKMRQYQLEGLNWMIRLQENGVNGILADEMGLGKTMQSISILVYMMEHKSDTGPHLIIVPKSTLSNWMNELERWAPTLTAVKFHGTKEERLDLAANVLQPGQRDEERRWNVCVTTYEVCNLDRNVFNKFAFSYLIIDEAHRLKNEASQFSKVVRTLETRFRLLLTGTPLQNNLHELWALLNFLVPDVFASSEQFDEWFNLDIDDAAEKNKLISQLHKILRPFMLRRLKADVEKSLPPKSETILFTGMSALQKRLYKDILLRDIDTLTGRGSAGGGSRTAVLNIVMQLRKCAAHPYLFPGVEDRSLDPLGEHLVENCGKMALLDKLLLRLQERGHRVLLFTQMTRILDIMEDYMHMRGFKYCRIDGNTTYEDREERIDAYNKPDSEKFLFLLSTRAGGLGINLQTADVVILYDSDWNPQADLQAQDRAHRIGQKRPVQVFRLVTEDTIEQKVVERAQQKLKLDAMVVQQGRLKEKDKLSREELLDAIRFGADKIFKSKDSSITDDDIDLILDSGIKKTQELNDKLGKLMDANKGDMLDFKLDGGLSAQTFEGVDYSDAKSAQFAQEMLGAMEDLGKRERRSVKYNENQLYMQQMKQKKSQKKKAKKEIKLPRMLRLPKMEDWQMFDRKSLYALQELEEEAFRGMPEEVQAAASGTKLKSSDKTKKSEEDQPSNEHAAKDDDAAKGDAAKGDATENDKAKADAAKADAAEADAAKANAAKADAVKDVAAKVESAKGNATEDGASSTGVVEPTGNSGTAKEEKGEAKGQKAEINLDSLPPLLNEEKAEEKARLLAEGFADWSRYHYMAFVKASGKYGRTNYAKIASDVGKPVSAIQTYSEAFWDENFGKKRFVESEYDRVVKLIEKGEKKINDIKGIQRGTRVLISLFENPWVELQFTHVNTKDKKFTAEEDRFLLCWAHKYGYGQWEAIKFAIRRSSNFRFDYFLKSLPPESIGRRCEQLMRAAEKEVEHMEKQAVEDAEKEGRTLPPGEIKLPMFKELQAKKRAEALRARETERAELEKNLSDIEKQIEQIQRALREADGVQTIDKFFRPNSEQSESTAKNHSDKANKRKSSDLDEEGEGKTNGAAGPGGEFVEFPEYDGEEEPNENKKAFTLFCKRTRKEVKKSLSSAERKNKDRVNGILKDRWQALTDDEKYEWKEWEAWDAKRYEYQRDIYESKQNHKPTKKSKNDAPSNDESIPKKRGAFSIPKKKKA